MESSITFSKCKRGLDHVFYYFSDQTCAKLFINPDHLKIIVYDGFKLPINKLNKYLKELGFVIYKEVPVTNSGNATKMFRIIGTKTICSFHDIKTQFPNLMTCCLNDNGLKIPGVFQMTEILNLSTNMIEFFKKLETEDIAPISPIAPTVPNLSEFQPITPISILRRPKDIDRTVVETKVDETPTEIKIVEIHTEIKIVEIPTEIKIVEKTDADFSNLAENKLLYAESELRVAQFKHNISYLEWCIEEEMKYRTTLKL